MSAGRSRAFRAAIGSAWLKASGEREHQGHWLPCLRLTPRIMVQAKRQNHYAQEVGRYCRGTAVAGAGPPGAAVQVHCKPSADDLPDR